MASFSGGCVGGWRSAAGRPQQAHLGARSVRPQAPEAPRCQKNLPHTVVPTRQKALARAAATYHPCYAGARSDRQGMKTSGGATGSAERLSRDPGGKQPN